MTAGLTVAEAGEHQLLARLRARVAPAVGVLVGIGDDAAVIAPPRGALECVTTDALVDGVHFDRRFCSAADVGHRALAVNLSDLAAMGAEPRLALLSLGLPGTLTVGEFDELIDGFLEVAARFRVSLVGGNLTRTPGPLFVDVTALGTARKRRILTRGGGRAGDELWVTGTLGAARAGLAWLMQWTEEEGPRPVRDADVDEAAARFRRPEPRVREGVRLARAQAVTACMDLSDGLADAATQVADASGVGVEIELAALPCHPAAVAMWRHEAAWQALVGGDDYELLVAVPPRRRRAFLAAMSHGRDVAVTRVGRLVTPEAGKIVRRADGSAVPLPPGYEHFSG